MLLLFGKPRPRRGSIGLWLKPFKSRVDYPWFAADSWSRFAFASSQIHRRPRRHQRPKEILVPSSSEELVFRFRHGKNYGDRLRRRLEFSDNPFVEPFPGGFPSGFPSGRGNEVGGRGGKRPHEAPTQSSGSSAGETPATMYACSDACGARRSGWWPRQRAADRFEARVGRKAKRQVATLRRNTRLRWSCCCRSSARKSQCP